MKRTHNSNGEDEATNLGGFLGGLGSLLEKLSDLAEKGKDLRDSGEIHAKTPAGEVRGVYGFSVKVCQGEGGGLKVEPFGNVRENAQTGKAEVDEVREPMVDVFEEPDHVLVVAEMPGVSEEDIQIELSGDILTIDAARGGKKYHKEVLLPAAYPPERMRKVCRNGVLEVRFLRA